MGIEMSVKRKAPVKMNGWSPLKYMTWKHMRHDACLYILQ